ncbi:hypothetical protein Tco_0246452 [Tanacetum coccineum]
MKRGFRGVPRPLLTSMLLVATNPNAGQEHAAVAQPSSSTPQAPTPPLFPHTYTTTITSIIITTTLHLHHHLTLNLHHLSNKLWRAFLPRPSQRNFSPTQEQAPVKCIDDLLMKFLSRSIDNGRRYKRRKETKGKKVVSSLDFQEEVDAGAEQGSELQGEDFAKKMVDLVNQRKKYFAEEKIRAKKLVMTNHI